MRGDARHALVPLGQLHLPRPVHTGQCDVPRLRDGNRRPPHAEQDRGWHRPAVRPRAAALRRGRRRAASPRQGRGDHHRRQPGHRGTADDRRDDRGADRRFQPRPDDDVHQAPRSRGGAGRIPGARRRDRAPGALPADPLRARRPARVRRRLRVHQRRRAARVGELLQPTRGDATRLRGLPARRHSAEPVVRHADPQRARPRARTTGKARRRACSRCTYRSSARRRSRTKPPTR